MGKAPRIVADAKHIGGLPRIENTNVSALLIFDGFKAGQSVFKLAQDYGVSTGQVEESIRFGMLSKAKQKAYLTGEDDPADDPQE